MLYHHYITMYYIVNTQFIIFDEITSFDVDKNQNSKTNVIFINMATIIAARDKSKTLAWRIRSSRDDMNWNQEDLAQKSGVSRSYISNIESGRVVNVTVDVVFALADALGLSRAYLIGLTDDPLGGIKDEDSDETKAPTPTVGAELLELYQQLSPQQQDTLLGIAKVLKAADEPKIVGGES